MALMTNNAVQKDYAEELLELLEEIIPAQSKTTLVVEAGHFSPRVGANAFSVASLVDALELVEHLAKRFSKNLRFVIAILVDDLGDTTPSPTRYTQSQRAIDELPVNLSQVLHASRFVKPEKLLITSERNAKNRALAALRKIAANSNEHLLKVHDGQFAKLMLVTANNTTTTLATFDGEIGSAKCPAIMGQHYADCVRITHGRFPATEHTIIVDWSEMLDFNKVTAGASAFDRVFQSTISSDSACDVINVFFGDADGFISRVHHQTCSSSVSL